MKITLQAATLLLLIVNVPVSGYGSSQQRGQHGPPPEAIEACEGKTEGDQVSFNGPKGEALEGICKSMNNQLAAVPEGGIPPRKDGKQ